MEFRDLKQMWKQPERDRRKEKCLNYNILLYSTFSQPLQDTAGCFNAALIGGTSWEAEKRVDSYYFTGIAGVAGARIHGGVRCGNFVSQVFRLQLFLSTFPENCKRVTRHFLPERRGGWKKRFPASSFNLSSKLLSRVSSSELPRRNTWFAVICRSCARLIAGAIINIIPLAFHLSPSVVVVGGWGGDSLPAATTGSARKLAE